MAEMDSLCNGERECSLCGKRAECFELDFAICNELNESQRKGGVGCVYCLAKGRFEFWHDTEIGVLDENGLTKVYKHNREPPEGFSKEALVQLRRTPQFISWQQELWLTHCNDFMVYQGTWEPTDFNRNSPSGDGRSLFLEMTDEDYQHLWDSSIRGDKLEKWYATYYVFR